MRCGADAGAERLRPHRGRCAATIFGLTLAGLTTSVTASAQTVRPIYREIGDWLLACDNVRDCVARQAPSPEAVATGYDDPDAGVEVARKAGPAVELVVRVTTGKRLDPATIGIAEPTAMSVLPWRKSTDGEDASLSGVPALRFVRAIADAPHVWLGDTRLSLKGLPSAASALKALAISQAAIAGPTVQKGD